MVLLHLDSASCSLLNYVPHMVLCPICLIPYVLLFLMFHVFYAPLTQRVLMSHMPRVLYVVVLIVACRISLLTRFVPYMVSHVM